MDRRHPALDGLRAVAIIPVVLLHSWPQLSPSGYYGVDVFFALSGFLITTVLLKEFDATGSVSIRRFFMRRVLRLVPALLFAVACLVAILAAFPASHLPFSKTIEQLPLTLFYVSDIAQGAFNREIVLFSHSWSLSVEEHFYLIWPFVLLAILRGRRERALLLTAASGAVLISVARLAALPHLLPDRLYYSPEFHSDGLLIGSVLALALRKTAVRDAFVRRGHIYSLIGLVTIVALCAEPSGQSIEFGFYGGFTIAAIATTLIIGGVVHRPKSLSGRLLSTRPLVGLGRISYGVYLWHAPIALMFDEYGPRHFAATFALAIVAATISMRFVERPFLKLKDRYSAGANA